ncbi:MAG: hypothetical protein MPK62_06260, partial [Alphaproteobacteria bacterium]|nr:hypothetical protein [Alphaproteobacteria bacterium]
TSSSAASVAAAAGEMNLMVAAYDDTGRTWPVSNPWELPTDADKVSTPVTAFVTLGLTAAAPTGGLTVPLAVANDDMPVADLAGRTSYAFPSHAIFAAGEDTATFPVTIIPGTQVNKRFILSAGAAGVYAPGDAGTLEFIIGAGDKTGAGVAIYPQELSVEQGESGVFTLYNLPGRPSSSGEPAGDFDGGASFNELPAGMTWTFAGGAGSAVTVNPGEEPLFPAVGDGESMPVTVTLSATATTGRYQPVPDGVINAFTENNSVSDSPFTLVAAPTIRVLPDVPDTATPVAATVDESLDLIHESSVPRTWPYLHPFEIEGPTAPATSVIHELTVELSEAAPAGGIAFALSHNFDDIETADRAPETAFTVPALIGVGAGQTTGTADITLIPGDLENKHFKVAIAPGGAYAVNDVGTVEYVIGAGDPPAAADDFAIFPATLTVEQGETASFTVVNVSDDNSSFPTGASTNISSVTAAAGRVDLPTGLDIHWTTVEPRASINNGNDGIEGNGSRAFEIPYSTGGFRAKGGSAVHTITASDSLAAGTYAMTGTSAVMVGTVAATLNAPFVVRVLEPERDPTPPASNPTGAFNFIETGTTPRTWPYIHPFEITGTNQEITVKLSGNAPTGGVAIPLTMDFTGISPPERAPESSFDIPTTIFVPAGMDEGTATVSITPGSVNNKRFKVRAETAGNFAPGENPSVEFIIGAGPANLAGIDFSVYPPLITVEQGGFAPFVVSNTSGAAYSGVTATTRVGGDNIDLPSGVDIHWNTGTPHATLTDGTNGVDNDGDDHFSFLLSSAPARGDTVRHLVVAAADAAPGTCLLYTS